MKNIKLLIAVLTVCSIALVANKSVADPTLVYTVSSTQVIRLFDDETAVLGNYNNVYTTTSIFSHMTRLTNGDLVISYKATSNNHYYYRVLNGTTLALGHYMDMSVYKITSLVGVTNGDFVATYYSPNSGKTVLRAYSDGASAITGGHYIDLGYSDVKYMSALPDGNIVLAYASGGNNYVRIWSDSASGWVGGSWTSLGSTNANVITGLVGLAKGDFAVAYTSLSTSNTTLRVYDGETAAAGNYLDIGLSQVTGMSALAGGGFVLAYKSGGNYYARIYHNTSSGLIAGSYAELGTSEITGIAGMGNGNFAMTYLTAGGANIVRLYNGETAAAGSYNDSIQAYPMSFLTGDFVIHTPPPRGTLIIVE